MLYSNYADSQLSIIPDEQQTDKDDGMMTIILALACIASASVAALITCCVVR